MPEHPIVPVFTRATFHLGSQNGLPLVYLSGFRLLAVTTNQMPALDGPPLRQPVRGPLGNRISIRQAAVLLGLNWESPPPPIVHVCTNA